MDPSLSPPQQSTIEPAAAAHVAHAANPTPIRASHNHPPYAEMITAAIAALKEKNGSSRRAIAKYIETHYSNLPPRHAALLTHHLKRLKNTGQIVMVKKSYKLPRSAPVSVSVNGNVNAPFDLNALPKKGPGRPPKAKPDPVPTAGPGFVPGTMPVPDTMLAVVPATLPNMVLGPETVYGPVGLVDGAPPVIDGGAKRGRGRLPQQAGAEKSMRSKGSGRSRKSVGSQSGVMGRAKVGSSMAAGVMGSGRPRGRLAKHKNVTVVGRAPPAAQAASVSGMKVQASGRPRGRPPKSKNAEAGLAPPVAPVAIGVTTDGTLPVATGGVASTAEKRQRRPSKKALGETTNPTKLPARRPKKPKKLSGKPVGRPKKNTSATAVPSPYSEQAIQDLKGKFKHLQSRIQQTASMIKPHLNNETAIAALAELEMMATMDVDAGTNVQTEG